MHKVAEALFRKQKMEMLQQSENLGDRIDGRAEQTISGDSDQPITIVVKTGIDE